MATGLNDIVDFLPLRQLCKRRRWSSALMVGALLGTPLLASETETRHAMAAMAAFAECKIMHSGYSRDRAQTILKTWIKNKGLQKEAEWLQSPQATQAVTLISEAMNKTCNGFDENSPQFIPAMEAIEEL
jgi:hypothetical protein